MSSRALSAISGRRFQSLNGLRAIAIILVFLTHVQNYIPASTIPSSIINKYAGQGWIGVDLFFVLSGFLITGILLDTREASNYFIRFYVRRILRIFPLYYLVLTTVIVAGIMLKSPKFTATLPLPEDRWLYFCYLTNWIGLWKASWGPNYLAHFWSLAIEEQFYLVWPLVVWMARPRAIPWIAGGLAAMAVMIRLAWVAHSGAQISIALATVSRMDELFIGALCAYLFRDPEGMLRIRKWLPWIANLCVGLFGLALSGMLFFPERAALLLYGASPSLHKVEEMISMFAECGGYTLLAVGFGALVLLAAETEGESTWMQRILGSWVLGPVGTYSYGIYVFHVPIIGAASIFVLPRLFSGTSSGGGVAKADHAYIVLLAAAAYIVLLAAVTFILSAISYECYEKRILRFKRYFEAKYSSAPCGRSGEVEEVNKECANEGTPV